MRKFFTLSAVIAMFLTTNLFAQDILFVTPGEGTLNDAIAEHQGNKIYQLQAGQWYGLTAPIENFGYHLQIIGEDYDDDNMPATLQTGTKADNNPLDRMFSAKGSITLKNIYVMNVDLAGQTGGVLLEESDSAARVVIDRCIFDPAGKTNPFQIVGGANKLYFTNSQLFRHGHQTGANDGHLFNFSNGSQIGVDTVYIENNTFVDVGMNFLSGNFANQINNFVLINHNTFIFSKSQLDWMVFEEEYYLTNNLFFDFMTSAYMYSWQPMPGGDAALPKPSLIYADTIPGESLPSQRIEYIQYNQMYRNPKHYDQLVAMNDANADAGLKANFHPLMWDGLTDPKMGADPDTAFLACREGQLFNHANNVNTDFPNWKFGNTTYDKDPGFNEKKIYELSDSLVAWQFYATMIHGYGRPATDYPEPSKWAQWFWDPDGDVAINGTWPVIDATYTDEATLKGSIENLPLGDLNWYPEPKARWEAQKDDIFAHIKSGNTDKFILTAIDNFDNSSELNKMYPNPAQDVLNFTTSGDNEITIRSIDGRTLRSVKNVTRISISDFSNGIYIVTIKEGNSTSTKKLIIEK